MSSNKEWPMDTRQQRFDFILTQIHSSNTYPKFCNEVHGVDLSQLNMIDAEQLQTIINLSELTHKKTFLDVGCGVGQLTKYIQSCTGASGLGVDLSEQMITALKTENQRNLEFMQADINDFSIKRIFDVIFFMDSWYFITDQTAVLMHMKQSMNLNSVMLITLSNYKPLDDMEKFHMQKTNLAQLLDKCGFTFETIDFTNNDKILWKQVKRSLDKYKKAFISEGCEILHQVRATESDLKNTEITNPYHYRYLYIVKVKR
ncbi:MAG: class I SAM-dependent methyltransferase [Oceanospirillaceae bacterium]|nr:class I SAM-dependent methyltransferase [Oceanospirillaceae bacterium]